MYGNERDIATYETILSGDYRVTTSPDFANYSDNSYHVVTGPSAELVENGDFEALLDYNLPWPNYVPGWEKDGMWYIAWHNTPEGSKGEYLYISVESYNLPWLQQNGIHEQIAQPCPTLDIVVGREYKVRFDISDHYGTFRPAGAYATIGGVTIPIKWRGPYMKKITAKTTGNLNLQFVIPENALSFFQVDNVSVIDIGTPRITNEAVIDGFTITGGNADGLNYPYDRGGGMYNDGGSPTVTNCIFSYNQATQWWRGIYLDESSPTFTNCVFDNNFAGDWGGGVDVMYGSPEFINCVFTNNSSENGGGIEFFDCTSSPLPKLINCTFSGNSALWRWHKER